VLVQSPIAITFYVAAALFLFVPYVMKKMQDRLAP